MSFLLTFVPRTTAYRCHAFGCSAAVSTIDKQLLRYKFSTTAEAKAWADADESEKAGAPTAANFKACKCTAGSPAKG